MTVMRLPALLLVTMVAAIGVSIPASASPRVSKVYAPNGRRVAVIKDISFGRKVHGPTGRRIATIKSR
jgi:hypothetical protein